MNNEPIRILTIDEVCDQLCIGKNAAYDLIRTGQLKGFRIKRIWKVPQTAVNDYVYTACNI